MSVNTWVSWTLYALASRKSYDLPLTSVNTAETARGLNGTCAFAGLTKQEGPPPAVAEISSHPSPLGLGPSAQHIIFCNASEVSQVHLSPQ